VAGSISSATNDASQAIRDELRDPAPPPLGRSPLDPLNVVVRHRHLIALLAKREIQRRYRGSRLGALWPLLQPLCLLGVYTFVFGSVLRLRWPARDGVAIQSPTRFALLLFGGLLVFQVLSDCVSRAPELLREHSAFVKKVVFPVEILPVVVMLSALFQAAIALVVLGVATIAVFGSLSPTVWFAPLALLPFCLAVLGVSFALASIGVRIRDTQQVIGLLVTTALFLSPVFYPLESVPENLRFLFHANPLSPAITNLRGALFFDELPSALAWCGQLALGWLICWAGFAYFARSRAEIADVV
jgi:lipopolysaccharide transport system permease protein